MLSQKAFTLLPNKLDERSELNYAWLKQNMIRTFFLKNDTDKNWKL